MALLKRERGKTISFNFNEVDATTYLESISVYIFFVRFLTIKTEKH